MPPIVEHWFVYEGCLQKPPVSRTRVEVLEGGKVMGCRFADQGELWVRWIERELDLHPTDARRLREIHDPETGRMVGCVLRVRFEVAPPFPAGDVAS